MDVRELLQESYRRIGHAVHGAVDDASEDRLTWRPDERSNTVGWLAWHLARVQDDHVADAAGTEQIWTEEGWLDRFGLPFDAYATGYGHGPEDIAAVRAPAELLAGYYDAVAARSATFIAELSADDLDRIVDHSWDPPVTLGVRLVSVLSDDLQHAGQLGYLCGLAERAGH